jgi:hypothetical protein
MSEIKKYQKAMNFKANPRYLTRDFIVPLYTGTEPDIVPETGVEQQGAGSYTPFPNDMPIVSPKEIQNQPYEQLNLAEGGSVERQGFAKGSVPPGYITGKELEELTGIPNLSVKAKELMYAPKAYKRQKNLFGDFYKKQLKAKYFDIGQGGKYGTLHYKKPTAEQIETMKEYHLRKGAKYGVSKATADRMKLFHNDPKLRNYVRNGKIIPDELLKEYDITRNEAAQSTFRLAQAYNGKKFANVDVGIPKNRTAGKKLFEAIDKSPFGNPYKMAAYKEALNVITEGIGDKYFETTTFEDMKREARRILQKEKIPVFDPTIKGSKGINVNELTGVTASSRNKSFPYSQFINLMEGNLNTKAYAGFNKQFEKYEKDLQNEIAKGNKGNPNKIIKEYKNYTKDFLGGLEDVDKAQIEKLGLPELSLKEPTELYGKKRTAQLLSQGLDLPASYKDLGYSIKVPKGTSTLKEFINNPEIRDQMIANIGCPTLISKSIGGRVNFSNGSNCYAKGLEKIKSGELNTAERNIAANFLKDAGADAKTIGFIKNAKNIGSFLFDAVIGKTPGAALFNFGFNVPFAIAEAQEGKPGRQVLGTATDIIGLGPLVGTTEKDELTKAMGADADLYLKINEAMEQYNDIGRQRQLIENSRSSFQSPEETPSDIREQDLQLASKKLNEKEKELYNFLSPYLNKQKEVVYPKNIEKGLQILEDQEKLRKAKSNLEMRNIPSVGEDTLSTDNVSFERSNENINKKIEELESKKPLYGSEIDKNMTPELMDVIYESGARGGAADGGRIGLKEGSGPKMGRRGFLGLLAAGAAAAPEIIKGLKGEKKAVQVAKLASKIKLEKAEGMYPWFPDLVEKIKVKGKPFEEKDLIMEASYKHEAKGYGGLPKGVETVTRHVDGDTEFLLREYPDGRIAVDIHSPRNQEMFETPVTLYYRPTMELTYNNIKKIEPAEFKVLEKEPRYFANGPDDVDIEMSETRKIPGKDTIYGDVEAAERFATGKIENRKIIPAKQARRDQMMDQPTDFIEETSPYGPVYD